MSDPYIGEIRVFGGNFAPVGWAMCNGQFLNIAQYDALFALIGTTYGGDGQTTFALPDLRGRIPVHMGTSPNSNKTYPLGAKDGYETATLQTQHLPAHTHQAMGQSADGNQPTGGNNVWAASSLKQYADAAPSVAVAAGAISTFGGGQPHENVMPSVVTTYIIALDGLWPNQG